MRPDAYSDRTGAVSTCSPPALIVPLKALRVAEPAVNPLRVVMSPAVPEPAVMLPFTIDPF